MKKQTMLVVFICALLLFSSLAVFTAGGEALTESGHQLRQFDVNNDNKITIGDVTTLLNYLSTGCGHVEQTLAGKAPTETETGLTDGSYCLICQKVLVEQVEIPALNDIQGNLVNKGISLAYIGDNGNVWLVFEDGSKIDTGIEGKSPTAPTYTVTFLDHDGTIIKTQTGIEKGGFATAPTAPTRKGYMFTGWSGTFDNVTSNLEVTAQYSIARNQLYFTYTDNADGTLTADLIICGDVNLYGLELLVDMNSVIGLSFSDISATANGAIVNYNGESIVFSYANTTGKNNKAETKLLEVTFDITGSVQNLEFEISYIDIFDDDYNDETYTIVNSTYSK